MRREIIIHFGRDPDAPPPGPLKRLLVGLVAIAVVLAFFAIVLVLGLSLLVIIVATVALAVVGTIIRGFFSSRPGPRRIDRL